eukprot:CCRYP_004990-RC/>CCRYP_004990-RC protein AED:0.42 eAED:0.43 QI:0/0/0/0.66/0/0/3/0/620
MPFRENSKYSSIALAGAATICPLLVLAVIKCRQYRADHHETELQHSLSASRKPIFWYLFSTAEQSISSSNDQRNYLRISSGGYESLIGNTPLVYLPHLSSLLKNNVKIYVKMENMNPGGTGKDRAALSMIMDAERRGKLPLPLNCGDKDNDGNNLNARQNATSSKNEEFRNTQSTTTAQKITSIPPLIHQTILTALQTTQTHGLIIEGTSGSTGISLASLSTSRGHAVIVVMPDDQSSQKADFLRRLGCGVVTVKNCSISNPGHYVNVAKRIWEWVQVERRYDDYYWKLYRDRVPGMDLNSSTVFSAECGTAPRLIKATFMNQFENLANAYSHYLTTGPEIYSQLHGEVDAFVMSAGTGGTIVGVGGYLKDKWWMDRGRRVQHNPLAPPKIVLVDPPGSSLYNKVKFGVAYAPQQSEMRLRRHRYDTLAEGIGLDRITANFGLGCIDMDWSDEGSLNRDKGFIGNFGRMISTFLKNDTRTPINSGTASTKQSKIVDDAVSITDQQAVYMAHYLLRYEGLFVGSSSAMNIAGAIIVANAMPAGSNVVTVVCDGGQRHTSRFWNKAFIEEWGLKWPGSNVEVGSFEVGRVYSSGVFRFFARLFVGLQQTGLFLSDPMLLSKR